MDEVGGVGIGSRINFGGLASGLDTGAIIEALMDLERRPLQLLQNRKSQLETQQSALQELNTRLLALRDAAAAIDNRSSSLEGAAAAEEFLSYLGSSSDESVLGVSVSAGASPGVHEVRVDQVAQRARRVSQSYADPDAALSNKNANFTIDFGQGQQINLQVKKNQTTLNELRDLINSDPANDGSVQAQLLFDGTGHRLVISGSEPGAVNDVTVTTNLKGPSGGGFLDTAAGQDATDAQLNYLGVDITRSSNDVTDLIAGVTLHLVGANDPAQPAETVTVTITRDDESIVEKVQALVDAYNSIRDFSLEQTTIDPDRQRGGALIGDPLVRLVERQLQSVIGDLYNLGQNPFLVLGQVGISFNASGRLTLDAAKLSQALDEDPNAVRELFSGDDTSDGAASALVRSLEPLVRSGDGTIALRDDGIDDRIQGLERQIERFEERLVTREETLVRQFSRLESLISTMQAQSGFLGRIG